jgi:hypothetical protein
MTRGADSMPNLLCKILVYDDAVYEKKGTIKVMSPDDRELVGTPLEHGINSVKHIEHIEILTIDDGKGTPQARAHIRCILFP